VVGTNWRAGLGRLRTIAEREDWVARGGVRRVAAPGFLLRFARFCRARGRRRPHVAGTRGFGRFAAVFQTHDVLVRNFPTKLLHLAVLLQVLFEKDRTARVGYKRSGSRQEDVAGAVMHLDPAPEKGGIAGHAGASFGAGAWIFNSTKVLDAEPNVALSGERSSESENFQPAASVRIYVPNSEWTERDNQGGRKQACDEMLFESRPARSEKRRASVRCCRRENRRSGRDTTPGAF
jgi:hypothetical protein